MTSVGFTQLAPTAIIYNHENMMCYRNHLGEQLPGGENELGPLPMITHPVGVQIINVFDLTLNLNDRCLKMAQNASSIFSPVAVRRPPS